MNVPENLNVSEDDQTPLLGSVGDEECDKA